MSVFQPKYANTYANVTGYVESYPAHVYQPETSNCDNKWCQNKGNIPATGQNSLVARCGDATTMEYEKLKSGGVTGRGVTPCPYGFLQKIPWTINETVLFPYQGNAFYKLSPSSIFFDPDRPTMLPPQGEPRSLMRIGYEWRN